MIWEANLFLEATLWKGLAIWCTNVEYLGYSTVKIVYVVALRRSVKKGIKPHYRIPFIYLNIQVGKAKVQSAVMNAHIITHLKSTHLNAILTFC